MAASRGASESGVVRRWGEAVAFVAVWVAAGELLDMSPNTYLLFGIPLTAGFQLFVRGRPIKALWVRDGPGLSWRTVSLILAIPLAIAPVYQLIVSVVRGQGIGYVLYALAAIAGAGAAAYALGQFRRETWRDLVLCLATAGLIGVVLTGGLAAVLITFDPSWHASSAVHPIGGKLQPNILHGVNSLLLYIPALFLIEEVAFRGAIDSHVRHPGEGRGAASTIYGVVSAIFVSVLWGLWHHPIVPEATIPQLLITQVAMGPFLSLFWRRSGNLMVPGFAHATSDAVRNALGFAP
jgi:membrane protease YdiL (CAAX protease family)